MNWNWNLWWVEKQDVLRTSCLSESERKEFLHLCFLDTEKKKNIFLDLNDKVWFLEKWTWIKAMIDSECTLYDVINDKYAKTWHLNIQKLRHDQSARDFDDWMIWITHYVVVKLWFRKHVERIWLLVTKLKNFYNMILEFQWLKLHNSSIDWIDETVKFFSQYCQSNCLQDLSWYTHAHDYLNLTWYELSLLKSALINQSRDLSRDMLTRTF